MGRAPIRVHRAAQRDANHAVATARLWLAILAVVFCNRKSEEWVPPVTDLHPQRAKLVLDAAGERADHLSLGGTRSSRSGRARSKNASSPSAAIAARWRSCIAAESSGVAPNWTSIVPL